MDHKERAERIRQAGSSLNYELEALEAIARSWDLTAEGNTECAALALADAQAWSNLAVAQELRIRNAS